MSEKGMGQKKNIILIGFMGCGKTTLGLRLSYKLRMPVEDTDKLIEQSECKSISQIFEEDGEAHFRDLETQLLRDIQARSYVRILSVGGGTPVNPVNREILKACGTVVYLKISPEMVYERLKEDKKRPLLQCDDPLTKIRKLMEMRRAAYEECADIIIDVDSLTMDEVVERLLKAIHEETECSRKSCHAGKEQSETRESKEKYEKERKDIICMKILVINGPNINFLGIREKNVYGNQEYQYLLDLIEQKGRETGNDITVFQSNHEGAIIDRIQEAYFDGTQAIVINPGAYTHYSYAIRDALASITMPKVEIHISDITKREDFRKNSVTAPACDKQIYGQGLDGYLQAIDFVIEAIS